MNLGYVFLVVHVAPRTSSPRAPGHDRERGFDRRRGEQGPDSAPAPYLSATAGATCWTTLVSGRSGPALVPGCGWLGSGCGCCEVA